MKRLTEPTETKAAIVILLLFFEAFGLANSGLRALQAIPVAVIFASQFRRHMRFGHAFNVTGEIPEDDQGQYHLPVYDIRSHELVWFDVAEDMYKEGAKGFHIALAEKLVPE